MKLNYSLFENIRVEETILDAYKKTFESWFPSAQIKKINNKLIIFYENKYIYADIVKNNKSFFYKSKINKISEYFLNILSKFKKKLPDIILIASQNQIIFIHSKYLTEYHKQIHSKNSDKQSVLKKMIDDPQIIPFSFDVKYLNENYISLELHNLLRNGYVEKVKIDPYNIETIFNIFDKAVLTDKKYSIYNKRTIFLNILKDPVKNHLSDKLHDTLIYTDPVTNITENIKINSLAFRRLFLKLDTNYTATEYKQITANCDVVIKEISRKQQGEFFTPTVLVREAVKNIDEIFPNWKTNYVVWDCACGTANLTRNYNFTNLFQSTLQLSDIKLILKSNYNSNSTKFQFDFLNDDWNKVPKNFKTILKKKPLLFFINPPYGRPSISEMKGVVNTMVGNRMKKDKNIDGSAELYVQFLYRILDFPKNKINTNLCLFTTPTFLTGSTFKNFRNVFLKYFKFEKGLLFNAGEFNGVSDEFSICFTIWSSGETNNKHSFLFDVKRVNNFGQTFNDLKIPSITFYNLDGYKYPVDWAKKKHTKLNSCELFFTPNGTEIYHKPKSKKRKIKNTIGFLASGANNIGKNNRRVILLTIPFTQSSNAITPYNFWESIALFTARKLIKSNWIIEKKEYLIPNVKHPEYKQWNIDCIVYSLFNSASRQSSIKNVVSNEWFWISRDKIINKTKNLEHCDKLYDNAFKDRDKFVYKILKTVKLSSDAQKILNLATKLVFNSIQFRWKHNLNLWDMGWYQIKNIIAENPKTSADYLTFVKFYNKFENRMRKGVIKFEFLK